MTNASDSTNIITAPEVLAWYQQIQADPGVSSSAFELAFVVTLFINRYTGAAGPTQEDLAKRIKADTRTVRSLTKLLVDGGHLEVTRDPSRHGAQTYRMLRREWRYPISEDRKEISGNEEMAADIDRDSSAVEEATI